MQPARLSAVLEPGLPHSRNVLKDFDDFISFVYKDARVGILYLDYSESDSKLIPDTMVIS